MNEPGKPVEVITRRKRGAQPGNRNALKHGYFSRAVQAEVDSAFKESAGLEQEAEMLRMLIRRLYAMADGVESMEELMGALRAVGVASSRLAALLRTQKSLHGGDGEVLEAINQAIQQASAELQAAETKGEAGDAHGDG